MSTRNFVIQELMRMQIDWKVIERYDEPHRFYHNFDHIEKMIGSAKKKGILTDSLLLAIVFHDIVYDPKATDNELKSESIFIECAKLLLSKGIIDDICGAILETRNHMPSTKLSEQLCELDLEIVNAPLADFIEFEHKIFKEYQFVDYKTYKEKRIEILEQLGFREECINYVRHRKPNIAVYPGSFGPYHKGHHNILEKAEKIFDKVIIAQGINLEKRTVFAKSMFPDLVQNRQIELYEYLLTDFIDSLGYEVTVIVGLRDISDFNYQLVQYRFNKDLKSDIKVACIFSDAEFTHVSSSAIRNLDHYNKTEKYLLK